jgi:hypothetical protein
MTFWQLVYENRTKLLGIATALVSAVALMTTSMTFDGLLEPNAIRWLGIFCNLGTIALGGATGIVGFGNTTEVKVAQAQARVAVAMETAINTPPPSPNT